MGKQYSDTYVGFILEEDDDESQFQDYYFWPSFPMVIAGIGEMNEGSYQVYLKGNSIVDPNDEAFPLSFRRLWKITVTNKGGVFLNDKPIELPHEVQRIWGD